MAYNATDYRMALKLLSTPGTSMKQDMGTKLRYQILLAVNNLSSAKATANLARLLAEQPPPDGPNPQRLCLEDAHAPESDE